MKKTHNTFNKNDDILYRHELAPVQGFAGTLHGLPLSPAVPRYTCFSSPTHMHTNMYTCIHACITITISKTI